MAINGGKGWNGSMAERDGNGLKARNGCNGKKKCESFWNEWN
jgi:hypothetical protein